MNTDEINMIVKNVYKNLCENASLAEHRISIDHMHEIKIAAIESTGRIVASMLQNKNITIQI